MPQGARWNPLSAMCLGQERQSSSAPGSRRTSLICPIRRILISTCRARTAKHFTTGSARKCTRSPDREIVCGPSCNNTRNRSRTRNLSFRSLTVECATYAVYFVCCFLVAFFAAAQRLRCAAAIRWRASALRVRLPAVFFAGPFLAAPAPDGWFTGALPAWACSKPSSPTSWRAAIARSIAVRCRSS